MTDKREYDDEYWRTHPFKVVRKKASPRVSDFEEQVMKNAERIKKQKGMHHSEILPFDERYYRLLLKKRRTLYAMTLALLADGLECSIDDLVEGCENIDF